MDLTLGFAPYLLTLNTATRSDMPRLLSCLAALIGGSSNHITLQPLSIEGMTGLNVAAGVAGLRLDYVANPS
jgi:hypothetical protein